MPTYSLQQSKACRAQIDSFSALRDHTVLTALDIHKWFNENINSFSEELSGHAGRPLLKDRGMFIVNVLEQGENLVAEIDLSWAYADPADSTSGIAPKLEAINGLLPQVHIEITSTPNAKYLGARLTLDLSIWQNCALSILHTHLYKMWANPARRIEDTEKLTGQVLLMLKHLYPQVTLNTLQIAAELGMVSNDSTVFLGWFEQHLRSTDISAVVLPTSF